MKHRIYIAGPISNGCLCANINQATAAFVELAKAGLAPFCPHWSVYSKPADKVPGSAFTDRVFCEATVEGNPAMGHADWIGIDLAWVEVSDALLRLPGLSKGADMEVAHAILHEIPVFHSVAEVVAWSNRERVTAAWVDAALKDQPYAA